MTREELPPLIKGVRGMSSDSKITEHLIKGILRAKYGLQVNKDVTIRMDATELPLVSFKPKEIRTPIGKLKELGYDLDIYGNEIKSDEQIIELMPHDVLIPSSPETPDEKGEVFIRGPHVTPGYIGRFSEVDPLENGWLPTGDIGYLDAEGYLYIVDRRSDMIISGGENIYPAEIENVLAAHPNVQEAGVCGKEHSEWGSVPIAFVVVSGNVTGNDLISFCEERLARYKVPKSFRFVDELPRNGSNKLLRRKLKELVDLE